MPGAESRLERLTFLYALALIALVVAAGHGSLAMPALAALPAYDKIGHFLLFGLLSYLVNLRLGAARLRLGRGRVLAGSLALGVVVVAEELSQIWIAQRNFEIADLLADAAGILVFGRFASRSVSTQQMRR